MSSTGRSLAGAAVLCATLALTGSGAAHEGQDFGHLNVDVRELKPGESRSWHLDPTEGPQGDAASPLSQGMVFIIYGLVQGDAPVVVNLTLGEDPVGQWVWLPGVPNRNTTRLAATGDYNVTLWNPSNSSATRYAFYFDMSCNCAAKLIPLQGGFVLFNFDLKKGRETAFQFNLEVGAKVEGALATLQEPSGVWPRDFAIVQERFGQGVPIEFRFVPPEDDRYYIFMEAVEGASTQNPLDLYPQLTVEKEEAPGLTFGAVLLATAALVVDRRRRHRA